jgi:hypothetical protein
MSILLQKISVELSLQQRRRLAGTGRLLAARRPTELLSILPHDRGCRPQPDCDAAALVDVGALGGNSTDDILDRQHRRHFAATSTGMFAGNAIFWC